MIWTAAYLGSVVAINLAFSWLPEFDLIWSTWVGLIFVLRDMVQTRIGHWSLLPMIAACLISWMLGDPFVAAASALAFATSETIDWLVFTITKRPLRDRLWISSACSIPIDTAVFCLMLGLYAPSIWFAAIASKFFGVTMVYIAMTMRARSVVA